MVLTINLQDILQRIIDTNLEDHPHDMTSVELIRENLSNQITESNTLQILNTPSSGGIQLSLNGQILTPGNNPGDYTLTNKTVTFNRTDIDTGDIILVSYLVTS